MSTNNQIFIGKDDNGHFKIWDQSINVYEDEDYKTPHVGYKVGETDSLEEAIMIAQEYMTNNIVEYGLIFGRIS